MIPRTPRPHSAVRTKRPSALGASVATLLAALVLGSSSHVLGNGGSATWSATPSDANWIPATAPFTNWSTGANDFPGATTGTTNTDTATFNSTSTQTSITVNSASLNVKSITFSGAAAAYTIGSTGGNSLLLTSGGTIQTTGTANLETVNAPLVIEGASGTYAISSNAASAANTLNIGGGITGGAAGSTVLTLTGTNTGNNTISGVIANGTATTVGLTKSGGGTWVLTGANTYTGVTTISGGTLQVSSLANGGAASGIGASSNAASNLVLNGGTLQYTGNSVTTDRGFTASNRSVIDVSTSGQTLTISGAVNVNGGGSGASGLSIEGNLTLTGTVNLDNSPNSNNALNITAGAVLTTSGTVTNPAGNNVVTGGTLVVSGGTFTTSTITALGNNATAGSTLTVSGGLFNQQAGGQFLLGQSSASNLNLNGGTLETAVQFQTIVAGNAMSFNGGTLQLSASLANLVSNAANVTMTVNSGGAVVDVNGFNTTISNALLAGAGSGGLTLISTAGGGTLTLSGANTYTGATTVSAGSLAAGIATNGGNTAGAFGVNSATTVGTGATTATLALGGFSNTIGTLTGNTNGIVQNGAAAGATLTTGSGVTSSATTTIFAGMLQDGGGGGTLALTKVGAGVQILTGANTYTGGTTFSNGILNVGSIGALGSSGTLSFTGGALQYSAANTTDYSARFSTATGQAYSIDTNGQNVTFATALTSSGGSLTKNGGLGALTLSAINTYTGATTVDAGTLEVGNGATGNLIGTSGVAVADNATLAINLGSGSAFSPNVSLSGVSANLNAIQTGTTTLSGVISGAGAVNQNGMGKTILTGANTYTGATNVNAGTLQVDGSTASPSTFVSPGALLQGIGVIGGNVNNNGGVHAGDSPGTLTVKGSYTQTGSANLRIDIASRTNYSWLQVGGQASLAGTVTANFVNGFTPTRGNSFTILTAGGGVSGTFSSLQTIDLANAPLLKLTAEYFPNDVVLEYTQGSFASLPGLTGNERAVGFALDGVQTNSGSTKLLNYLDGLPLAQIPGALDRIAAAEYGAIYQISISGSKILGTNVENRLDEVHAGSTGAAPGPMGPPDEKGSKEIMPASEYRGGVWSNGSGEFVSVGDTSNARGYNFDSGGVTAGVDYRITDHFLLGALFNYTRTDSDLTGAGSLDVDTFRGGAYASLFGGGAYMNAFVGGGDNSYDFTRRGLNSFVRGGTNGGEFNALIQTGYDAHAGAFTYGPVASFQYTYTGLGAFNETGSLAPLHIDSGSGDSLRTNVGMRATYDWHIGGMVLTPEVRATWQHEFGDVSNDISAELLLGSPTFRITSAVTGRDSLLLNAGFTLQINSRVATYAFYDGELARTNYQANNVMAGIRVSF